MNSKLDSVKISVDNNTVLVDSKHQTGESILRAAGLDPQTYDLVEIIGHGNTRPIADDQKLAVKDGDDFVSVRQAATVA